MSCPAALLASGMLLAATIGLCLIAVKRARDIGNAELLRFNRNLAETVNPLRVERLADIEGPEQERLGQQLRAAMSLNGLVQWVAIVKQVEPGGEAELLLFHGRDATDKLSEQSLMHALKGKFAHAVRVTGPVLLGGLGDGGRDLLVSCAPITDAGPDEVALDIVMLGTKHESTARLAFREGWPAALLGLSLGVFWYGWCRLRMRAASADQSQWKRVTFLDSGMACATGLILTLIAVWEIRNHYHVHVQAAFIHNVNSKEQRLINSLFNIRNLGTHAITSFFESSDEVDAREFASFTRHLSHISSVETWAWVSRVGNEDRRRFEHHIGVRDGIPDFGIWEWDAQRKRVPAPNKPVYFPISLMVLSRQSAAGLGLDIGADPTIAETLARAAQDNLATATPVTELLPDPSPGIVLVHPVTNLPDGCPAGFALAVVNVQELLQRILSRDRLLDCDFYQVFPDGGMWLVSTTGQNPPPARGTRNSSETRPVLAFGNTYALRTRTGPGFQSPGHSRPDFIGFVSGLLVTGAMTTMVATQGRRREKLEAIVADRTRDLQGSENRYDELAKHSGTITWEIDATARYTFISEVVTELLGYSPAEIVGRWHVWDLHPEKGREEFRLLAMDLLRKKEILHNFENPIVTRDGRELWVESTATPIFDDDGRLIGARGWDMDITARRKSDEKLQLLGAALNAAGNSVMITDVDGRIEWINRAFTESSGYSMEEVVGKTPGELLKSGAHSPDFYQEMWRTILAGKVWSSEIINRRKDGTELPEWVTITPMLNPEGDIGHFIAIKRDLTSEKLREKQLLRTQRLESIGTLAGGIAHDLNNALAPVMMAVDMLKVTSDEQERSELLHLIQSSARRGAGMVQQLLAFARGSEGSRELIDPRRIVAEIENLLRDTFPREIRWQTDYAREGAAVMGDATQMHQVLLNLCVNARDAMPEGGTLTLGLANVEIDENHSGAMSGNTSGKYVRITVSDTGDGIPDTIIDRIFDPFFTTKGSGKGSGLGLPTSHKIVKDHGGFILVSSPPDGGCRFEVFLPARQSAADPGGTAPVEVPPAGGGESILIADDDTQILQILTKQG